MSVLETIRVALRALGRNTLRSFLTTLGVVIGVGAVIAIVAIGEGAKAKVQQSFSAMGSNLLIVMSGSSSMGGAHGGAGSLPSLTWDDFKAIQTEVPTVRMATPQLRVTTQVLSEDQNWTTQVLGTNRDFFQIRAWEIARGSFFGPTEEESGAKVVVLGQTVVDKLYGPNADPVGQTVRIKNVPFLIIGVTARKGQSPMGTDYDDQVVVPLSAFLSKIQGGLKQFIAGVILVSADSPEGTRRAETAISNLLRDRHHIPPGGEDDFFIRNLTEIATAQEQGTRTLTTLLAAIAAVSLLVGGIGIMNIMLVSVTERTREIGLRMAVGAKPRDILLQFLTEALALSVIGGLIGIALGLVGAQRLAASFGWPMLVRPDIIVLAVGFSGLVGVMFGLYPARKASRLDPIEALRYE